MGRLLGGALSGLELRPLSSASLHERPNLELVTLIVKRFFSRRCSLLLLVLAGCGALPAFGARTAVRNYTARDGLPQAQVTAICQDPQGHLWVGTESGGLGRYDGHRWDVFDASTGLPASQVSTLALDTKGTLIVGTSGGAARFVEGRFVAVKTTSGTTESPSKITAILADEEGRLFLGTRTGLLMAAEPDAEALKVSGPDWLADSGIEALTADGAGGLWVGTTRGLARLEPSGPPRLTAVPGLPEGSVTVLLRRAGHPLLVGILDAGLFEGEPGAWKRIGTDEAPGRRITALRAESGEPDAVWIGTSGRGAFRWRGEALERFGPHEGLPSLLVYAIFEDQEGLLWFGTEGGLTKKGPSAFLTFDQSDGFPAGAAIFGMAESTDGSLWYTAWESGLLRIGRDGSRRLFTRADGLPDDRVTDTAADPAGGVFVATRRGLARIDGDRVSLVPLPEEAPVHIRALFPLPDGALVVTAGARRAWLLRGANATELAAPVGIVVTAVCAARDGTIWYGGEGWGAVGLKPGRAPEVLSRAQGLPSNQVTSIFQDGSGRLWVGTDRGAFCREPNGKTRLLDRRTGLPDSFVYWVGEDREQGIWFGTNHGAARLDAKNTIDVYTARDGLGADECNEDGFLVDSKGRVTIATIGVSLFLGRPRPRRSIDPRAEIGEVLVEGRTVHGFAHRLLPPGSDPITFRFAALSFIDEHAVRFRYRLVGLSEAWSETAPGQFEITYGGLGAGSYEFQLKAITVDGRTSREAATAPFAIRPVWWRSRTVATGALLGLLVLAFAVVRVREERLVNARRKLEREVAERTDELRGVNERLAALAVTDELTGLANRRRILESVSEALAFARRRGTPLSIALADLDHFKLVNDTMGHAVGDRQLFRASRAMQAVLRTEDLLGRYGGEEFLAVLPGTDLLGALAAAERMRSAVAGLVQEEGAPGRPLVSSVSIGVASLDDTGGALDAAELIRRADGALYRAKALGRNRAAAYGDDAL
ncbi:MAG: diguanylate cyclase [Thermoanaerobaculia bacterium]